MMHCYSFRIISFALLLLFVLFTLNAYAGSPVPDTGQTGSYTSTFGEDSDYLINPPSYKKLGYGGAELDDITTQAEGWIMTRDNVTGLVWEIKTDDGSIHDKDNTYIGTDTEDFIATLNVENFGGFSDWRLPTRKELRTIVNYGTYNPSIDSDFFPNTHASFYWSSTTYAYNTSSAWGMNFGYGYDHSYNKSNAYYVRAVRGGQ